MARSVHTSGRFVEPDQVILTLQSRLPPTVLLMDAEFPYLGQIKFLKQLRQLAPATALVAIEGDSDAQFRMILAGASGGLALLPNSVEGREQLRLLTEGGAVMQQWVAERALRVLDRRPVGLPLPLTCAERRLLKAWARGCGPALVPPGSAATALRSIYHKLHARTVPQVMRDATARTLAAVGW
ncbi:MAG: hypothetical protein R3E10_19600 [Gemmatimonadota bacterium]